MKSVRLLTTDFLSRVRAGSCHTLDWGSSDREKKKKAKKKKRAKHTEGADGTGQMEDVPQVVLKNRGLVLVVVNGGDKFWAVAAKYGQTVAAVNSWGFQRAGKKIPEQSH